MVKILENCGYKTRLQASLGLWLWPLFPLCLLIPAIHNNNNINGNNEMGWNIYQPCLVASHLLVSGSSFVIYYYYFNPCIRRFTTSAWLMSSSIIFMLLVNIIVLKNFLSISIILYTFAMQIGFFEILHLLLKQIPFAFTWGEACVVAQLIVASINYIVRFNFSVNDDDDQDAIVEYLITIGATIVLLFTIIRLSLWLKLALFFAAAGIFLCLITPINFIRWIITFLTSAEQRFFLFGLWSGCVTLAVIALGWQILLNVKGGTIARKTFHILIFIVFLTGTLYDRLFLYLASGLSLCIILVVEMIRWEAGRESPLQWAFEMFAEEKEIQAGVALTPIYLMLGCALPFFITPNLITAPDLLLLAGALSIGVGDAFASIIGKAYGTHQWPGTNRTIEGTIAALVSQSIVVTFFLFTNPIHPIPVSIYGALAIVSLVEAFTDQIDNLVLPLITYLLFTICFSLENSIDIVIQ